jgi:NADPH-dependent curcumin reductase CurA
VDQCPGHGRGDRTLRGFIVSDYYPERLVPIRQDIAALLRDGRLRPVVTEFDGLDSAPEALRAIFDPGSRHVGKRVVRIAAA